MTRTISIGIEEDHRFAPPAEPSCNCGCGKDRATVIREIMRSGSLNEDQAADQLLRANAARLEQGLAK